VLQQQQEEEEEEERQLVAQHERERNNNTTNVLTTRRHYWQLLLQYAQQHTRTYAVNDTAQPLHSGHVFENLHPDLGYWNNRQRMYWHNDSNKNMGDDYNHSTFCDLVLSGLLGIRPQRDGSLVIHPLIVPSIISCFAVDHVRIRNGIILSMVWDRGGNGCYPGFGRGLTILLDGNIVAQRDTIERIHLTNLKEHVSSNDLMKSVQ